jgi:hypothetical protein
VTAFVTSSHFNRTAWEYHPPGAGTIRDRVASCTLPACRRIIPIQAAATTRAERQKFSCSSVRLGL